MFVLGFILLGSLAWFGAAHPVHSDAEPQWLLRERRSPTAARTMILIRGQPANDGYQYERPTRAFNPQAAMAAYATGGTVAAGSFYRTPARKQELVNERPGAFKPEEEPKSVEELEPQDVPTEVEVSKEPLVPERKPKASNAPKVTNRRPSVVEDDDDEDDDEDSAPRQGGRRGGSVYRNFFPMTFGGAMMSRSRDAGAGEGEGGRGPVTAIANSFSKGRGAIAHSSAVAHGNPDASQYRQRHQNPNRAREQTNVNQPEE